MRPRVLAWRFRSFDLGIVRAARATQSIADGRYHAERGTRLLSLHEAAGEAFGAVTGVPAGFGEIQRMAAFATSVRHGLSSLTVSFLISLKVARI